MGVRKFLHPSRLGCLFFASCAMLASAGDWPQLLGPSRDGHAVAETLRDWTASPPEVIWRAELGAGYAGCAVVDGHLYVAHRKSDQSLLDCLDAETGNRLWRAAVEASYRPTIDPDDGPRCVPVVAGDRVILHGADGRVSAVGRDDGSVIWSAPLRERFRGDDGFFGAGSTPLVHDGFVFVAVGGRGGAGIVALKLADGEVAWTSYDGEASYSSPVLFGEPGRERVLMPMRLAVVLVDPKTGNIETEYPFGLRDSTVTASTPLVRKDQVFLSASYQIGARLVDFQVPPKEVWSSQQAISSQYPTPLRIEETVFGFHGREDYGLGELRAIDWATGKVLWREREIPTLHLIGVGDEVLGQTIEGRLLRFAPRRDRYERLGDFQLPAATYRALPALADGVLYCRSSDAGRGELLAVRVGGAGE